MFVSYYKDETRMNLQLMLHYMHVPTSDKEKLCRTKNVPPLFFTLIEYTIKSKWK